jgi:hypothetical protein
VYGPEITIWCYKCLLQEYVMLCYGFPNQRASLAVLRIPTKALLHHVVQVDHKIYHMYDTKNKAHPHSIEQYTQPITFLISKQAVPYWTRGGTCCPRVPTPKIRPLADLSTICHDGINHLHHSINCSNHNTDLHTAKSHLNGWKTTRLSQRHKPNSISQWMEDLHNTYDCMTKHK